MNVEKIMVREARHKKTVYYMILYDLSRICTFIETEKLVVARGGAALSPWVVGEDLSTEVALGYTMHIPLGSAFRAAGTACAKTQL